MQFAKLMADAAQSGPEFFSLAPLLVFIPVVGLLINIFLGGRLSERWVGTIAILAAGLTFVVAALLGISLMGYPEGRTVVLAEWMVTGDLNIEWAFRVDSLSVAMMLVVSGIGTLIHIYAAGYMHYDVRYKEDEKAFRRFFIYMNLFIAAMMILVSGDNYLMLFVGWEGVGLCSYLLIGFWYNRNPDGSGGTKNSSAGKKAFITNRIGDFGFLIAMFLIFWYFGSLQFDQVFTSAQAIAESLPRWVIPAIGLFMLLGVTGKSAQIPLYVWLPDAMAGPTPVSALIHAATMVTAGVYLVTRSAPLFALSHDLAHGVWYADASYWVALVGAVTALFAATIAVGQFDIKKVLAYSTVSQLGFMVAAVGLGGYVAGMFHLITHAFFKALLFLGSGSVILGLERGHHPLASTGDARPPKKGKQSAAAKGSHKTHAHAAHTDAHGGGHDDHGHAYDPQDMRNMGGLRKKMPTTFWVYIIGTLALAGIFPFAGFWSKDEILADAAAHNLLVYVLLSMAAFLTAFYMGRQIWMVFFGTPRSEGAAHAKESPRLVTGPLIVLAALSALGGLLNIPGLKIGDFSIKGPHSLAHWLEHTLGELAHVPDYINLQVAILSTAIALIAIAIAWLLYGKAPLGAGQPDPLEGMLGKLFTLLNNKWYVDEIYEMLFLKPYRQTCTFLADRVDWDFWHNWFHDTVIARGFHGLARFLADPVDLGFVDRVSTVLAASTIWSSGFVARIQNGFVRNYALFILAGMVAIISYLVLASL